MAVDGPETDPSCDPLDEEARAGSGAGRESRGYVTSLNRRKGAVHFVEVKTRRGISYGTPGEAVTYAKRQKIRKTALLWLQEQDMWFPEISFDVIEILVVDKTAKIRWLTHCF